MADVFVTITTPAGKDLTLHGFRGEEGLSSLFRLELDLISKNKELDFKKMLGKSATLKIGLKDKSDRYLNGIITRFTQAETDGVYTHYRAELRPWLSLLALTADNRIFQNKTTPEILEAVFSDLGFTDFKNSLKGVYAPREYCVQYHESTLSFVLRLMEDEGIFYFFTHEDGKHTLVLGDDSDAYPDIPGDAEVPLGVHPELEPITECFFEERVITNEFSMTDYNFEVPTTDLFVKTGGGDPKLGWYEYPGIYAKKDEGDSRAKLRIEAREHPSKALHGRGHCRSLVSGHKWKLSGHQRAELNQEYVAYALRHEGTVHTYENRFEAFPASLLFRPPQITPWPRIAGSQTALVVGKSGEEIWTDKYGRIKVQFHWDRLGKKDENSSIWIRVSHSWAGKGYGTIFIPRIGQEVVVSFLDGNPDRPLVTGVVYNAQQTVPYALPDNQTRSTLKTNSSKGGGGDNELRFEDKKDSEEIFLHAQKDFNQVVENDKTTEVKNDEKITVKHDQTIEVENDQKLTVKKNRTTEISEGDDALTVKKGKYTVNVDEGDSALTFKGKLDAEVHKEETHTNKKKFTHEVDDEYVLTIKKDLKIEVDGDIKIVCKKSISMEGKGGIKIESGQDLVSEAKMNVKTEAKMELGLKAGTTLKSEGAMVETKASATMEADGGGMLTLKGGMVKIN